MVNFGLINLCTDAWRGYSPKLRKEVEHLIFTPLYKVVCFPNFSKSQSKSSQIYGKYMKYLNQEKLDPIFVMTLSSGRPKKCSNSVQKSMIKVLLLLEKVLVVFSFLYISLLWSRCLCSENFRLCITFSEVTR